MKKKIAALVVATTALTGGALAVTAVGADAAVSPGCVDRTEFSHVHQGMTPTQVKRAFHGLNGKTTYSSTWSLSKEYKPCHSRYGFVDVDFSDYNGGTKKVDYKSAYWG